jgi:alpha-beta hydrolase superfamily lysophospholipase
MEHKEGHFSGVGDLKLYYQSWHPEGEPCAVLCILSGAGGHSGQYSHIGEYLASHGYAVYGLDSRGMGRSEGFRGHVDGWEDYRGDVRRFLNVVGNEVPGLPVFLLGQSAGALMTLDYALHEPEHLQGIVASGVPLEQDAISPMMLAVARLLARVWPRFSVPLNIEKSAITRDPAEIKKREEDPLWFASSTARSGVEFLETVDWVKAHVADLSVPLLMNHGEKDTIALPGGPKAFYETVTYPDKELCIYEGGYHDPYCDLNRDQVLVDLEDWIERHL